MQKLKEKKGITLIALIVTIVVLIILAGITISAIMGNNGIITKAQYAANETTKASILEEINRTWLELMTGTDFLQLKVEKQAERFQTELRGEDEFATATVDETDDTKINVSYKGIETVIDTQGGTKDWIDNGGNTGGGSNGGGNTGTGTGGSSGSNTNLNSYTIKFNTNGGTSVASQIVGYGKIATMPSNPSKENYQFSGWYTDKELSSKFSFSTPITTNVTLFAKWTKELDQDNFTWLSSTSGATITGFSNSGSQKYNSGSITEIVIPSTYNGVNVTKIGSNAFAGYTKVTKVVIPDNVTVISNGAFSGDTGITDLTLPINLNPNSTNNDAFKGCTAITRFNFTKGAGETQGVGINYDTNSVQNTPWYISRNNQLELDFENGIESIGNYMFYNCTGVKNMAFAETLKKFGNYSFYNCKNLVGDFTIFGNIEEIGNSAFYSCTGLDGSSDFRSLKKLGNNAFQGCTGLTYSLNFPNLTEIGSYAFYGCSKIDGTLTIPNTVTTLKEYTFYNCTGIEKLVIGNSVTSLGEGTFAGCTNITNLTMPISLNAVASSNPAFANCSKIRTFTFTGGDGTGYNYSTSQGGAYYQYTPWYYAKDSSFVVNLENGVARVGNYMFYNCIGLEEANFPTTLTSIGVSAFDGCKNAWGTDLKFTNITEIGSSAFNNCPGITIDGTTLSKVTTIGSYAFYNLKGITGEVNLNSVVSIENDAFRGCSEITKVVLGEKTTKIIERAFRDCSKLAEITVPISLNVVVNTTPDEPFYNCTKVTKVNFTKGTGVGADYTGKYTYTPWYESRNNTIEVTMEEGITSIGSYMFRDCTGITTLNIPSTVTSIGTNTFYGCNNWISTVNLKQFDSDIGSYAFYNCKKITGGLELSENIKQIGDYTFYNCNLLSGELVMSDDVTSIGQYAFSGCTGMTGKLTIPSKMTTINYNTFEACGISQLEIKANITKIVERAFRYCNKLSEITVPISLNVVVNTPPDEPFYNCTKVTKVNFTKGTGVGADYTGKYTYTPWYESRNNTIEVTMEEGITSIGSYMFRDCTGITTLNIPSTVTSIGTNAFYGCSNWSSEVNLKQFDSIGSYAFYNCQKITGDFTISNKLNFIGEGTFYNCQGLKGSIVIPESVYRIYNSTFYNCTGLTSVELPVTILASIGSNAFYNCTNLGKVNVPYQATIGDNAFYNVTEIHYDGKSSGSPWGAKKVSFCQNSTFTTTKAATCQTRGSGYYNCDLLGERVDVTLVELNHTPNYVNDVCSICGYKRRWKNTSNGDSYKFVQNGGTWTSNNKGVAFSTATSTWTANLEEAETYTLKYKVSSEQDNDVFTLTLDGKELISTSGNGSEVTLKLELTAGEHILVATYTKDSSNNGYDDKAYVVLEK